MAKIDFIELNKVILVELKRQNPNDFMTALKDIVEISFVQDTQNKHPVASFILLSGAIVYVNEIFGFVRKLNDFCKQTVNLHLGSVYII